MNEFEINIQICSSGKGQLFSEWIYEVIVSPKYEQKILKLTDLYWYQQNFIYRNLSMFIAYINSYTGILIFHVLLDKKKIGL